MPMMQTIGRERKPLRWLRKRAFVNSKNKQSSSLSTTTIDTTIDTAFYDNEQVTSEKKITKKQQYSTEFFDCLNPANAGGDPRYTLTDWERESVICLEQACDEKKIHYNSLFELAKCVLISRSCCKDTDPKASQKRLKNSLNRLKKRQVFEAKYKLNEIDPNEALEKVAAAMPEYFINEYTQDEEGRVIAAHGPTESTWIHESKQNLAYWLKAELYRGDLAAANMEEARKGIALLLRIGEGTVPTRVHCSYLRMFLRTREMGLPCHNHRLKKLYVQTSPAATSYVTTVKKLLPAKIAQRVVVVSTLKELNEQVCRIPDGSQKTVQEWACERRREYETTLQNVDL